MKPTKTVEIEFLAEFKELFSESWRNIVFYGGRGSGKSQHVALALILRGRQKRLRILCTRELQNTIADSVHKLLKDIIDQYGLTDYEVTDKTIRNRITGTEFIFRGLKHNATEIKSTEGIDIAWVEEAHSITKDSLSILAPTVRKPGSQLIFTFNRQTELDPVYVRYVRKTPAKTYARKVNFDVLDRAGLFPDVLRLEMEEDRKDPDTYAHVWLGEPEVQADNAVIGRGRILQAMERAVDPVGAVEIGVDVAGMGNDRTAMYKRKGLAIIATAIYRKMRPPEVSDKVEEFAGLHDGMTPEEITQLKLDVLIKVDDTGIGGGVTGELIRRGWRVVPLNFGEVAQDQDRYPNMISEGWFYLESIIDTVQLPFDDELLNELSTRLWNKDEKGRRRVESKKDYKKRGNTSPDKADAIIICFYNNMVDFDVTPASEDDEDEGTITGGLLNRRF